MHVPKNAMQKIFVLHKEAEAASSRRDEAIALVLSALGAPSDALIQLQEDGSGLIVLPNVGKDSENISENATDSP